MDIKRLRSCQANFPAAAAFRIGFWLGGIAPVFSSRSNSTNNFSASRSFSSSVISGIDTFCSTVVPVIGLIETPEGVTNEAVDEGPGALKMPLLNRKPATLPYPTWAERVEASESHMANSISPVASLSLALYTLPRSRKQRPNVSGRDSRECVRSKSAGNSQSLILCLEISSPAHKRVIRTTKGPIMSSNELSPSFLHASRIEGSSGSIASGT